MITKAKIKAIIVFILGLILLLALFVVVLKPVFVNYYISHAMKYTKGRFSCSLDDDGNHISRYYKISNGKAKVVKTNVSNSCIFSTPKLNTGFFVLLIGAGGGATPYENGKSGQIISKHMYIHSPLLVMTVGKGGSGTYLDNRGLFIDAKNGGMTKIDTLNIIANGGYRAARMTPIGMEQNNANYHIPEKFHLLYNIPKSAKYGLGGQVTKKNNNTVQAADGFSGVIIIQW